MAYFADVDASQHPETNEFSPIPEGVYDLMITGCTVESTKNNTGKYLKFEFTVVNNAQFNNRKIWQNINFENVNKKAEDIGLQQLSRIMEAVGIQRTQNTDDFMGKALRGRVFIRKGEGQYRDSNEIKKYEPIPSYSQAPAPQGYVPQNAVPPYQPPQPQVQAPPQQPYQPQTTPSGRPW